MFNKFKSFNKSIKLFILTSIFAGFSYNCYGVIFNLFLKHNGYSEDTIGQMLSIRAVGSFISAGIVAFLIIKFGRKIILYSAITTIAIQFLVPVLTTNQAILTISSFLFGAGSITLSVIGSPFYMDNSKEENRTYIFAISDASLLFSGAFGSFLGGFLAEKFNYEITFFTASVFSILSIIPILFITDNYNKDNRNSTFKDIFFIKDYKPVVKILFPTFFVGLGAGLTIPFLNLYFKNVFKSNDAEIGLLYGSSQFLIFTGMMIGPKLAKRIGNLKVMLFSQLLSIPFLIILANTKLIVFAIISFLCRDILMNMSHPLSRHFSMEVVDAKNRQVTNALISLTWSGSWVLSSFIGGKVIHYYGFVPVMLLTALFYFIDVSYYFFAFGKKEYFEIGRVSKNKPQ